MRNFSAPTQKQEMDEAYKQEKEKCEKKTSEIWGMNVRCLIFRKQAVKNIFNSLAQFLSDHTDDGPQ